jgi:hypothetical protein
LVAQAIELGLTPLKSLPIIFELVFANWVIGVVLPIPKKLLDAPAPD